ncbi:hypothetical protein ACMFMF_001235 [Clarireedia jacksonii]
MFIPPFGVLWMELGTICSNHVVLFRELCSLQYFLPPHSELTEKLKATGFPSLLLFRLLNFAPLFTTQVNVYDTQVNETEHTIIFAVSDLESLRSLNNWRWQKDFAVLIDYG